MLLQQLANGAILGMVYALIAIGFSLTFGILGLVNFSHGGVYASGAYIALLFVAITYGIIPALLLSVVLTGILCIVIDKLTLAPLRAKKSPGIAGLITTIGIYYIIQNLLMIIFGSETKPFPKLFDYGSVTIGGVSLSSTQLCILGVSITLLLLLTYIIKGTRIGLAIRAVEQNTKAASLVGVNVNHIITFTFFLSGAAAAIAGTLISGYYQMVYPNMGFIAGLKAYSASVLGGITVIYGSVFGGVIVGISENFAATYLGGTYRDAIAFIILIIVLLVKPTGLFGKKGITKV